MRLHLPTTSQPETQNVYRVQENDYGDYFADNVDDEDRMLEEEDHYEGSTHGEDGDQQDGYEEPSLSFRQSMIGDSQYWDPTQHLRTASLPILDNLVRLHSTAKVSAS